MKRRNLIIPLLLVVAMVVGIGYAAISKELKITSSAQLNANDQNMDVVFIDAKVIAMDVHGIGSDIANAASVATASIGADGNGVYSISGLSHAGDTVTLQFTIQNQTADALAKLVEMSSLEGQLRLGDGAGTAGVVSDYFDKQITIVKPDTTTLALSTVPGVDGGDGSHSHDLSTYGIALNPTGTGSDTMKVEIQITLKQTLGVAEGAATDSTISLEGATVFIDFSSAEYSAP